MRCASVGAEASPYVDRVIADASATYGTFSS
jgi:hypothetical protein